MRIKISENTSREERFGVSLIRKIPAYRQAGDDKEKNLSTNCTNKH